MGKFNFKTWMVGQLRRAMRKYPPYYGTLNTVKESYYIESKKGKQMKRCLYTCTQCHEKYKSGEVSVDHIQPVVDPATGFPALPDGTPDWNVYIARLFCPQENLQVLCSSCHDKKTAGENELRDKGKEPSKIKVRKKKTK